MLALVCSAIPSFAQRLVQNARRRRVFARQNALRVCKQSHAAAEARESLREFTADGPGADDGEPRGALGQRENIFVVEVAALGQPWNRRHARPSAAGDDGLREFKLHARVAGAYFHLRIAHKTRVAEKHIHAELVGGNAPPRLRR